MGSKIAQKQSYKLLDLYFELGGNFLDTANKYSFWLDVCTGDESEKLIGNWIKDRKNRDQIIVATKVEARPNYSKGNNWPNNMEGLSAGVIESSVDNSLKRLKIDYLDLCYAHIDDKETPLEVTLYTFDNLIKKGKIRNIGASNISYDRFKNAIDISHNNNISNYCCVQQRHTYLRPRKNAVFSEGVQKYVDNDMLNFIKKQGNVTLLANSPLLGGAYTNKNKEIPDEYCTNDYKKKLQILNEIAKETGCTSNHVIYAWMLQGKPSIIPIIAGSSKIQILENIYSCKVKLNDNQLKRLNF